MLFGLRGSKIDTDNFFTSLYKLSLLNALALTAHERDFYTKKNPKGTFLERPPAVSKEFHSKLVRLPRYYSGKAFKTI